MQPGFQSTCPARGTTCAARRNFRGLRNFNPRAPRGARLLRAFKRRGGQLISIHVPREGHDFPAIRRDALADNFNPRAPRGARQISPALPPDTFKISIHVPREGHDCCRPDLGRARRNFNPRAPRGARPPRIPPSRVPYRFQSTCPARGTTARITSRVAATKISIHVPREGHDCYTGGRKEGIFLFQSTCPARGTTFRHVKAAFFCDISIHVPREGHDPAPAVLYWREKDFNPRAPRGARPQHAPPGMVQKEFQSTCPARGTTEGIGANCRSAAVFQSTCPARGTTSWARRRRLR